MQTSKLSRKGQVTIPREIREAISLEPRDTVSYEVRNETVILKRVERFDAALHAALSDTLDEWGTPDDEDAFRDL